MKKTFLLFTIGLFFSSIMYSENFLNSEISIYNEVSSAFEIGFYPGTVEKANLLQKLYPDSVFVLPSLVKKGESLINLKEYDEAIITLEDALSRMHTGSEDFARCYFLLGKVLYLSEKYDDALSVFHNACVVSFSDDSKEFYNQSIFYASKIYYQNENYKKAIPLYEYIVSNGKSYTMEEYEEALLKLVTSYNNSEMAYRAVDLYNKISRTNLKKSIYLSFCLDIAESYEKLGDYLRAYEIYCSIVEEGNAQYSVVALKKSYKLSMEHKIGVNPSEVFEKTSILFEDNPEFTNEFWIRLGIDEYNRKNFKKAVDYFNNVPKDGLVILYKQKIALVTEKNIDQIEKNLIENKDIILSSGYENISDAYYSILLQLSILRRNWSDAEEKYKLLENPNTQAVYQNACSLYAQNRFEDVVLFLEEKLSITKYPVEKNFNLWALYASSLARSNKVEKAVSVYKTIDDKVSLNGNVEYAKALFITGNYSQAKQIVKNSEKSQGKYIAGLCSINLKQWKDAEQYFIDYINNEKSKKEFNNLAYYYKGYAEYSLGNFSNAYNSFVNFEEVGTDSQLQYLQNAYEFGAKAALQKGNYKNAIVQSEKLLESVVSESQKQKAVLFCAEIYSSNKEYDKAITMLMPYTQNKNDFAVQVLLQIAKIYVNQDKIQQADKIYEQIYSEYTESEAAEEALYRSGEIFYAAKEYKDASARFNKYVYRYINGKFSDSALFYCGDSFLKSGEIDKSIMMNKMLIQKYPESIYCYGTYKNLMNAYIETENNQDALDCAKIMLSKYQNQAKVDDIESFVLKLEKIADGIDPRIAELILDYQQKGQVSTKDGRIAGTELVKVYAENRETLFEAYNLALKIVDSIKDDSENYLAAQNTEVIADYYQTKNENSKAAEMYLRSAEYYRNSSLEDEKVASVLYRAVEAFSAGGFSADAKQTAELLKKLYPESKQAKNVKRLLN